MQSVSIRDLDALWRADHVGADAIQFDLSRATYIAHDALIYLVGVIQYRAARGQLTKLVLPKDDRVLDFLRAWQFPEAVQEVTNLRFEDVIDESSRAKWPTLPAVSRYERVIDKPDGGRETLLAKQFFALTALRVPRTEVAEHVRGAAWRTAALERDRWLQQQVVSVLGLYLRSRGDEVATNVIYEAVLNAARHPAATLGYVSSQLVRKRTKAEFGEPEAFEIAIWDNGRSYADTLDERIKSGGSIYGDAYGKEPESFDVAIMRGGAVEPYSLKLTHQDSGPPATRDALTVAAFMLGVTSRPDRANELPFDSESSDVLAEPGTGLYYVRKTVLDKFDGSIRYLSGDLRLSLSQGDGPGRYHALVHRSVEAFAPVAGNLLIARIPVQPGVSDRW
jgi:hypothetical protein